jgi:hypothetical protein
MVLVEIAGSPGVASVKKNWAAMRPWLSRSGRRS